MIYNLLSNSVLNAFSIYNQIWIHENHLQTLYNSLFSVGTFLYCKTILTNILPLSILQVIYSKGYNKWLYGTNESALFHFRILMWHLSESKKWVYSTWNNTLQILFEDTTSYKAMAPLFTINLRDSTLIYFLVSVTPVLIILYTKSLFMLFFMLVSTAILVPL